ncbi:MAG: MFS transporter [Lachnospiraceae bacterium]|jgi:cyanate permease
MDTNAPKITARSWVNVIFLMVFTALITCNMLVYAACTTTALEVFNCGIEQMTLLASATSLVGVFTGIIFGRMLDAKDVKKCVTIFLTIGTVCFFIRAFVFVFAVTLVLQFLGAFCVGICQVGAPKIVSSWFPQEKVGFATQVLLAGAGIGPVFIFAIGTALGIKTCLLIVAIAFLALLIFWIVAGGEGPFKNNEEIDLPKSEIAKVYKSPTLWKLIITYSVSITAFTVINSYLISAFLEKGLDPTQAGMAGTVLNLALLVGGYLAAAALGALKKYRPIVILVEIGSIVFFLLSWFTPIGVSTWVFLVLAGLFFGGSTQLQVSRIPMIPITGEFSSKLIGTANGFAETMKGIIAFVTPSIISFACGTNFNAIFIVFAALCAVIIIIGALFIPELGEAAAKKAK